MRHPGARIAAALAAASLAVAGCGGSDSPLGQTADRLGDIHSGVMELELSLTPAGADRGISVRLDGPFSLAGDRPLPVARVRFVQEAGGTVDATFTSTGTEAFVTAGGRVTRLSDAQVADLRTGAGETRSLGDLGLDVESWVDEPKTAAGPRVDGEPTERITGRLDAEALLGDLARASRGATGLSPEEAERLARTVSSSSVEVLAGEQDHLLRRLTARVDLAVPPELRDRVGGRAGLRVALRFGVSKVNEPVTVQAPAGA